MKFLFVVLLVWMSSLKAYTQQAPVKIKPEGTNKVIILFDAFGQDSTLKKGWGYSALVEYNGKRILFDAGSNSDTFKENVLRLGIDLSSIDFVVVSHSHYDHLNGIDYLLSVNPRVKIYFPHDIFWGAKTVFNAAGQDPHVKDSLPESLRYFDGKSDVFDVEQSGGRFLHANIEFVKDNKEIIPGIRLIATDAKYMGYFSKYPKSFTTGNFDDEHANVKYNDLPELSLSLRTEKGEVLFVGCSHTGVENIIQQTISHAKNNIDLVVGGFHLLPFDRNETTKLCNMIKHTLKVNKVAPGHCTGHLAFKLLRDLYKDKFIYAGLGETLFF